MNNILEYKGYFTKIEYSAEDNVLYGKIEGINDLVNFESESSTGIEKEFHSAVDDYLELCKSLNKEPDKVFKGSFNIRISPELHKKASCEALKKGISLNKLVEDSMASYLYPTSSTESLQENIEKLTNTINNFGTMKNNNFSTYLYNQNSLLNKHKIYKLN